jgi:hypothetical protein
MFPKSYNYPISWDVGGEVFGYEFKWKKKSNQRVSKTFNPLIYNCLFFREAYSCIVVTKKKNNGYPARNSFSRDSSGKRNVTFMREREATSAVPR